MSTTSEFNFGKINDRINGLSDQIVNLGGTIAIVISGNVVPTGGVTAGKYYIWNGYLRLPTANIAAGETLTDVNMPIEPDGGLNALDTVYNFTSSVTATENATINNVRASKCGHIALISFFVTVTSTSNTWLSILNIPNELRPYAEYYCIIMNDSDYSSAEAKISYNSLNIWRPIVGKSYLGNFIYITEK